MTAWKLLDLRQRKTYGPHDGELIVLHMIPKSAWGRSEPGISPAVYRLWQAGLG